MKNGIGIADKDRVQVAGGVAKVPADICLLYIKAHGFHWNVTGPLFPMLHAEFERQYADLQGAVDEIAELIRMLGEPAAGKGRAHA